MGHLRVVASLSSDVVTSHEVFASTSALPVLLFVLLFPPPLRLSLARFSIFFSDLNDDDGDCCGFFPAKISRAEELLELFLYRRCACPTGPLEFFPGFELAVVS